MEEAENSEFGRDYVMKKCMETGALHTETQRAFKTGPWAAGSRRPCWEACSWGEGGGWASGAVAFPPRHPPCLGNESGYYVSPFPDEGSR